MHDAERANAEKIGRDDPRYAQLLRRGFNKRYDSNPDYFRLATSTADVIDAVQAAVRENLRVAVRSGGHCLEGFVGNADIKVIIDLSLMTGVTYDNEMRAFAIEPGTTLGELHRRLYLGWGVVLPCGQSPDIGVGGHALGSAFGFLHRQHGLAGDFLYAVEVVVVGDDGVARSVIATREATDANRELWWAHTGGGGGNFGVVTRYWFRAHNVDGRDAMRALPAAPPMVTILRAEWNWASLTQETFITLVRNYGQWCEHNSDAASPNATVYSELSIGFRDAGTIEFRALSFVEGGAEQRLDEHVSALNAGVGAMQNRRVEQQSWIAFAQNPLPELFATAPGGTSVANVKMHMKDALLRTSLTDVQIGAIYKHLTLSNANVAGRIGFAAYGGRVNSVPRDATAAVQRSAIMEHSYSSAWQDSADEARNLAWMRNAYGEVFAETGGVPAPGDLYDGALINHPDADLANDQLNTSAVPWHALYYGENYPRLQRVKAQYDPRNVFRHALSIRLPQSGT